MWTVPILLSAAASAVLSYVLGGVNGAILTSRLFFREDVRRYGSGNAGLTNFCRTYGVKYAPFVVLCDAAKAVIGILVGGYLFGRLGLPAVYGRAWAGLFAVLGHIFPVRHRFQGGKGILCGATLLLFLDWRVAVIGWGLFVLMVLLFRYISLGSVAAAASYPVSVWFVYGGDPFLFFCALAAGLLVLFAHRENISRLLRGEERRFSLREGPSKEEKQ